MKSKELFEQTSTLPPDLAQLQPLWDDWVEHRKQLKRPLTPVAVKRQIAQFREWGIALSEQAMEKSIMMGWRGLFKPEAPKWGARTEKETAALKWAAGKSLEADVPPHIPDSPMARAFFKDHAVIKGKTAMDYVLVDKQWVLKK